MKSKILSKGVITLFAAGALTAYGSLVQADDYVVKERVQASDGTPVRDSQGDCVRTPYLGEAVIECDPDLFVEEEEPVVMTPVFETITISSDVLFDFDSTVIKPEAADEMAAIAERIRMKEQDKSAELLSVELVGHTDSIGTEEYNQGLSERRAQAVEDYIVEHHDADADLITTRGEGEMNPVASNDTREGRALNRRVELIIGVRQRQQ